MPLYNFKCDCGAENEMLVAHDEVVNHCGMPVTRMPSVPAKHIKGRTRVPEHGRISLRDLYTEDSVSPSRSKDDGQKKFIRDCENDPEIVEMMRNSFWTSSQPTIA